MLCLVSGSTVVRMDTSVHAGKPLIFQSFVTVFSSAFVCRDWCASGLASEHSQLCPDQVHRVIEDDCSWYRWGLSWIVVSENRGTLVTCCPCGLRLPAYKIFLPVHTHVGFYNFWNVELMNLAGSSHHVAFNCNSVREVHLANLTSPSVSCLEAAHLAALSPYPPGVSTPAIWRLGRAHSAATARRVPRGCQGVKRKSGGSVLCSCNSKKVHWIFLQRNCININIQEEKHIRGSIWCVIGLHFWSVGTSPSTLMKSLRMSMLSPISTYILHSKM